MKTLLKHVGIVILYAFSALFTILAGVSLYAGQYIDTAMFTGLAVFFLPFVLREVYDFVFTERRRETPTVAHAITAPRNASKPKAEPKKKPRARVPAKKKTRKK